MKSTQIPLFQIDAFASKPFQGNPAAVCPLDEWLADGVLCSIAGENNLSETAFYVERDGNYELRWFTPVKEVDLCGHATLAAAHVIFASGRPADAPVTFKTRSGPVRVFREGECLTLDFPAHPPVSCDPLSNLVEGLGAEPIACYRAMDYMAVFPDEKTIRNLRPDFRKLQSLDLRGVIVTAPGTDTDFVSRFFAPNYGVDEDPVTGSAHCTLSPYWAGQLGKLTLTARQLSKRTGDLACRVEGNRVFISGQTVLYMKGTIYLSKEIPWRTNG